MTTLPIVTGQDVAHALGLPASTAALDSAAVVASGLIGPYLSTSVDRTKPVPAPIHEAGIVLAIDVFQNRTAAGGQSVGIDGGIGPYRMGKSLLDRISGLIGPWLDQGSELA